MQSKVKARALVHFPLTLQQTLSLLFFLNFVQSFIFNYCFCLCMRVCVFSGAFIQGKTIVCLFFSFWFSCLFVCFVRVGYLYKEEMFDLPAWTHLFIVLSSEMKRPV